MKQIKKYIHIVILLLGISAGMLFSTSTSFAISSRIVQVNDTITVSYSYAGGYDYAWYADDPSILQVEGSQTSCRLTGKLPGSTIVHCHYKFNHTYYDYLLKRPVTIPYTQEEKFTVAVTNGEVTDQTTGKIIRLEDCQDIKEMSCGLLPVKKDNLWGFVDKNCRLVIPFQFDDVKYIFNYRTRMACVQYNGSPYAINEEGERFGPLNSSPSSYQPSNNLTILKYRDRNGSIWMRHDGTEIKMPANISSITDVGDRIFEDDILIPAADSNGQYGYLNKEYQWVIQPSYDTVKLFHENCAGVRKNNRWYFIDRTGAVIHELPEEINLCCNFLAYEYGSTAAHLGDDAFYLADGQCPATNCTQDANCGRGDAQRECHTFFYINEYGEKTITEYQWGTSFTDGMAVVVNQEGYEGVIDTQKQVLIPFKYKYHYDLQHTPGGGMDYLGEGVFSFHDSFDSPYILLDSNGNQLTAVTYDRIERFRNGIARVRRNEKYGYINADGKEVIPVIYDSIRFLGQNRHTLGKSENGCEIVTHPLLPCPHEQTELRNAADASCTQDGSNGEIYCTECGARLADGTSLPATGHTWSSWKSNEAKHWKECFCQARDGEGAHTYTWIIDRAATASTPGEKHEECTVCGRRQREHTPIDQLASVSDSQDKKPAVSPDKEKQEPQDQPHSNTNSYSLKKASVSGIRTLYYTGKALTQKNLTVKANGTILQKGKDYQVSYSKNKKIGTASLTITGLGQYKDSLTKTFKITVKRGSTYVVNSMKYRITNSSTNGKGTVTLTGSTKKKSDRHFSRLSVKDSVTIGGKNFRITAIGSKAFQGYHNLQTLTIGKNVSLIGSKSFSNCSGLKNVSLGAGTTKISDQAFSGCKRLKNVVISSKKLKTIGKQAFKNIHKKAVFQVPSSKKKQYRKLLNHSTGFLKKTMKL